MRRTTACLALLASTSISPARSADEAPTATTIILRPAGEPTPALRYRILPDRHELIPGNAAIFYHRALLLSSQARQRAEAAASSTDEPRSESSDERIYRWNTLPLDEVPRDEAKEKIAAFANALNEVVLGASRADCDWEFDLRTEGFSLLIPEIQKCRSLSGLVQLRARLAILDGDVDEAFRWIQTGFALARHLGEGPTMIQALVGAAIESRMSKSLEELIQAPGTPSLYWALANRPRPFIDIGRALDAERTILEREIPALRDLDADVWSRPRAARFAVEFQRTLGNLTDITAIRLGREAPADGPPRLEDLPARLAMIAMVARAYPEARRALIAEGRLAAEVDAMPAVQAALLHAYRMHKDHQDQIYKWIGLPYWQGAGPIDAATTSCLSSGRGDLSIVALFDQLFPPLNAVLLAMVRGERQLDALQAVEAIRLEAAARGGAFPPSLDAIAGPPAPAVDPATGKPFEYAVGPEGATLSAPLPHGAPDDPAYRVRYVLKMAR